MWSWNRSVYERACAASWTSWASSPRTPRYTDPEEWVEAASDAPMRADIADFALAR